MRSAGAATLRRFDFLPVLQSVTQAKSPRNVARLDILKLNMESEMSKPELHYRRAKLAIAMVASLCLAATGACAQQGSLAQLRQACRTDFKSLCSGVQPGGGRILACLKENASKLSPGCKQALEAANAAREQRQQQGSGN